MKKLFLMAIIIMVSNIFAAEPMLQETPYKYVAPSIGKGKVFFLEVGSDSCHSCQIMGRLLYKVKQNHPNYQIHFINVKKEREAAYELAVRMIPTQIVFDKDGQEVYRHIGPLDNEELLHIFQKYNFNQ